MKNALFTTLFLLYGIYTFGQEYNEINSNPDFKGFSLIESHPQYPGGIEGFKADLSKNIEIPKKVKKNDLHGSVLIRFIIQVDGSVSEIAIIESDDKLFNKPTIKAIKKLKKWKPAIQNGKSVKVAFQQKVNY
tara:strand:- start:68 stop:466 length:399 start_codon:yes stop_codon:yes gene_type:complete